MASRWDGFVASTTPAQRLFDASQRQGAPNAAQQNFIRSSLLETRINTIDSSFYDCVYGIANTQNTVIERCYKDIGCCQDGCCDFTFWHNRYGWAVALLVIFCILVIIAVVATLVTWLFCRSQDKKRKQQAYQYQEATFSAQPTPTPQPQPEQYSFEPPHYDGYRY